MDLVDEFKFGEWGKQPTLLVDRFRVPEGARRKRREEVTIPCNEWYLVPLPEPDSPVNRYNIAVIHYRRGDVDKAKAAFEKCMGSGEMQLQAAYARRLCQRELGIQPDWPDGFTGDKDAAEPAFLATNFMCHCRHTRFRSELKQFRSRCEIELWRFDVRYRIEIDNVGGQIETKAWRVYADKEIEYSEAEFDERMMMRERTIRRLIRTIRSLRPDTIYVEPVKRGVAGGAQAGYQVAVTSGERRRAESVTGFLNVFMFAKWNITPRRLDDGDIVARSSDYDPARSKWTTPRPRYHSDSPPAVEMYNTGVWHFNHGRFLAAKEVFEDCFILGKLILQCAYARRLCQRKMGMAMDWPRDFEGNKKLAGPMFVATNVGCHASMGGCYARVGHQGSRATVDIGYDIVHFRLEIEQVEDELVTMACRFRSDGIVRFSDLKLTEKSTVGEHACHGYIERALTLGMAPMNEWRLKGVS